MSCKLCQDSSIRLFCWKAIGGVLAVFPDDRQKESATLVFILPTSELATWKQPFSGGIFKKQSEAIAEYHGCPRQRTAVGQTMNYPQNSKLKSGDRNAHRGIWKKISNYSENIHAEDCVNIQIYVHACVHGSEDT